ncbi:MAG: EamA family transporter [Candidatus Omnitrophica bacterium]|nr:EamA family transporter [Candidatus Omnitrophota bacterium]MDD5661785.1 EamA family transporter [Candidatus Omnitrophota bacterium]
MFKNKLTLKLLFFLVLTDFLETFIHLCFKKSTLLEEGVVITSPFELFVFLQNVFSSPFLLIGLVLVVGTFILWSSLLSRVDLSVAVPICSFSYILIPLASIIFLHEKVSFFRWGGVLFILLGVVLVSLSTSEKGRALE